VSSWLLLGTFVAVAVSFVATELLLAHLGMQRQVVVVSRDNLALILVANGMVLLIQLTLGFAILELASAHQYAQVAGICFTAQLIWVGRYLWLYHRDFIRLSPEV
jgi:hypothetical protein